MVNFHFGPHSASYALGFASATMFFGGLQMIISVKRKHDFAKSLRRAIQVQIQRELQPGGLLFRGDQEWK
jgi:hypothetical protein